MTAICAPAWATPADVLEFANRISDAEVPLAIAWATTRVDSGLPGLVRQTYRTRTGIATLVERLHVIGRAASLEATWCDGRHAPSGPLRTALTGALVAVCPGTGVPAPATAAALRKVTEDLAWLLDAVRAEPALLNTITALTPGWADTPESLVATARAVRD